MCNRIKLLLIFSTVNLIIKMLSTCVPVMGAGQDFSDLTGKKKDFSDPARPEKNKISYRLTLFDENFCAMLL